MQDLKRSFACDADGVTLTDTYLFNTVPDSLAERFVTWCEPVLSEGTVLVGDTALCYDPTLFSVTVTKESYSAPRTCGTVYAYLIDLIPKKLAQRMTLRFRFDILD